MVSSIPWGNDVIVLMIVSEVVRLKRKGWFFSVSAESVLGCADCRMTYTYSLGSISREFLIR